MLRENKFFRELLKIGYNNSINKKWWCCYVQKFVCKKFLLSISMLVILGKVFVKFLWTLIKQYFQKKNG